MEAGAVPRVAPPLMPTLSPRILRLAPDSRLVGLVREGRPGAFETVYDRHHKGILSFCRHMLGDQDEAEDAVQHTFMAAYADLTSSEKPIHLRPWLFAIARNRCYSLLRARRERPASEFEEPVTEGLASQVQRRQELRDLVSDLRRLPDEQRAAIVLAELDSLSHSEIGEVLGVPREKVKALVFQARESLLASRTARDTACAEIREQIACGRGGTLRRANLRRHLRDCDGCRAYRREMERQRKHFAVLLPVAPTLLLKEGILAAAVGGGAVAVGGGGLIASTALKTGFVKGVIAVVMAGVGTAGTVVMSASQLPVRSLLHAAPTAPAHPHQTMGAHHHSSTAAGTTGAGAAVAVHRSHASPTYAGAAIRHGRVTYADHRRAAALKGRHHHHGLRDGVAFRRGGHARHRMAGPATAGASLLGHEHHGGAPAWAHGLGQGPPGWAHGHGQGGAPAAAEHGHANAPGHAGHVPPGHAGHVPPGHAGHVPPGHAGHVPPGHAGHVPPGHYLRVAAAAAGHHHGPPAGAHGHGAGGHAQPVPGHAGAHGDTPGHGHAAGHGHGAPGARGAGHGHGHGHHGHP